MSVLLNKKRPNQEFLVPGPDGTPEPGMMIRMRCEGCFMDHRMVVAASTPIGLLPDIASRTMRCKCKRHIPTFTKMDKSLMSINGVPFRELEGLPMFAGTKWSS